MLQYPQINPIALSIGPMQVHWYGIMYMLAFLTAWILARYRIKKCNNALMTEEELSDLIFYVALGIILGGRIGYVLFYAWREFVTEPLFLIKIWEGGMSFHGGLLGAILAMAFYARKISWQFLRVTDFVAPLVPSGLAYGRLGNFINGELWGRATNMPWGMVIQGNEGVARHPSQLYEFFLEGVLLFILVWVYSAKPRPIGRVSALFLIGYAIARFAVEFFRQPDLQLGFVAFNWLTMGQLLSLPMLFLGIWLWWRAQ